MKTTRGIFDFDYVEFFFASMTILTLTQSTIQEIVFFSFMLCEYKGGFSQRQGRLFKKIVFDL